MVNYPPESTITVLCPSRIKISSKSINANFIYIYISLTSLHHRTSVNKQNDHLLSSLRIYLLVLKIAYSNYLDDFFNLALSISKGISCLETLFDFERRLELLRETLREFFTCLLSCLSSSWMELMWVWRDSISVGFFSMRVLKVFHYFTIVLSYGVEP